MKKCSSCTKDLPDAALHCVFCGAKQAPSPAAQPAMAKTVMGYGGNEDLNKLREQAAAARSNSPSSSPMAPPMAAPPVAAHQPNPYNAPRPQGGSQPPPNAGYSPGNMAPTAGAQARTMFVDGPPPAAAPAPRPMQGPMVPGGMPIGGPSPMADVKTFAPDPGRMAPAIGGSNMGPSGMGPGPSMGGPAGYNPQPAGGYNPQPGGYNPQPVGGYNPQPVGGYNPQPVAQSAPYPTPSHARNQGARPIEPWKETLRTMMFIWGGVLIACFAVPISISPMIGYWNFVIDGEGTAKLVPLILAAVGILSVVVGAIPMASTPRGAIAAVLGLAGIFVPIAVVGSLPEWQGLLSMGGTLLLVPALLVRNEYTESPLPRILITVGALAALAPFLIPQHGSIPLVEMFKALIDAPGKFKVAIGIMVAYVLVLVLTLLAWMPSPATAGAKVLAWVLMLFPLVVHGLGIALSGGNGVDFEHALNPTILGWAYGASFGKGASVIGALGLGTAYVAIASHGLASVIGKKLE